MKYLAVYTSQLVTVCKAFKTINDADLWLAEQMRTYGQTNVKLYITEILTAISG